MVSQYTRQTFEGYLSSKKIRHSFSRKNTSYDNACIESFHSVRKKEEIYLHTYQHFKESRKAIFEYIESWYNRKRIHSAIDYMTPQQKEDKELKKQHRLSTFFIQKIDINPKNEWTDNGTKFFLSSRNCLMPFIIQSGFRIVNKLLMGHNL